MAQIVTTLYSYGACIHMGYIVTAYVGMAYIVMACHLLHERRLYAGEAACELE